MICPIMSKTEVKDRNSRGFWTATEFIPTKCLRGECAWWNRSNEMCSVRVMGTALNGIEINGITVRKPRAKL